MSTATPTQASQPPAPRSRAGFRSWPRWGRFTTYAVVAVVLVLVAALVAAVLVVRQSFPQTGGEIAVPGLDGEVRVVRDAHGIPQVYAGTSHDLFYAQGFVQAQDRFYEMDVRRHTTAGRLSELFGEGTLQIDKTVRTMGWRRVAEQELSLLSPETQDYLRAYSDGVNAYLADRSSSDISLEYAVLGLTGLDYSPAKWTPADSVSWLKAMAWDLRSNMDDEIQRGLLSGGQTPEDIADLYPPYPYDRHRPAVDQGAVVDEVFEQNATAGGSRKPSRPPLAPAALAALRDLKRGMDQMPALIGKGDGLGSNAWVVDGDHSTTGKPILANDPHLGVSLPGVWYQMGLHCTKLTDECPFDVSGFTFAGLPGVVIGHNQEISWGFTNLGPDVVDLFLEKVQDKTYLYDGVQRPLLMRDEEIKVLGRKQPFRFTVRSTRHGPLLSDVDARLSTVGANAPTARSAQTPERGNGYAVALSWTALTPSTTADALFGIDRATSWEEFRAAAEDFAVPAQNMVYADRDGNIGYQAPGRIPIRKSGNAGDYPASGWLPADDWTGTYVPFAALPSVLNPSDGFIATANQPATGRRYPYYLGDSWAYGYRSQRIVNLLQRKARVSVADMSALQLDTRNGFAPTFVPYLLEVFMPSEYLAGGQRLLQGWDFRQRAGLGGRGLLQRRLAQHPGADLPRPAQGADVAGRRRPLVRGDARTARAADQPLVGRRHHRRRDRGARRHPAAGDGRRPRRAGTPPGPARGRLDLGPPAPAGPAQRDPRHRCLAQPGALAVQPRRLAGRRWQRDRQRQLVERRQRLLRGDGRAVHADGRLAGRPRRVPVDQPDRRERARLRRRLRRPDRAVGRGPHAALGVVDQGGRGRGGGHADAHAGRRSGGRSRVTPDGVATAVTRRSCGADGTRSSSSPS